MKMFETLPQTWFLYDVKADTDSVTLRRITKLLQTQLLYAVKAATDSVTLRRKSCYRLGYSTT